MQQIRSFNPRSATLGQAVQGQARNRKIRGYDNLGTVIFTIPASTAPRETVRSALDARAIREKVARHGAKLTRCEIDAIAGGHNEFMVAMDGSIREAFRSGGRIVTFAG